MQKSLQTALVKEPEGYSITTYNGELTMETATKCIAKVKAAFPALAPDFYKVLIERLQEKGFSDERLTDAVNNVIDNCQYPTPTLANFLSFDRRVKVLDYNQLVNLVTSQQASFDDFVRIKMHERFYYVRKSEKELYNIPEEI